MTPDEAIDLVKTWPKNRSVPRKLAAGILAAKGQERAEIEMLVEVLMVACKTPADYDLVDKYFAD